MVIVMQEGATDAQIQHVIDRLIASGFDVHRSTGASHTVLGAVGVMVGFAAGSALPQPLLSSAPSVSASVE